MEFQYLLEKAQQVLRESSLQYLLEDRPMQHAPQWHVYGVLGHAFNVVQAAQRLSNITGIDIKDEAILHDIGKLWRFPYAVRLWNQGHDPAPAFNGHEVISAKEVLGLLGEKSALIIATHGLAYQTKPETIVARLGDAELVRRWLLLCAADAVGKGFTDAQKLQRPLVAAKFREVARVVSIPADDVILKAACEATENWPPLTRDEIPRWA